MASLNSCEIFIVCSDVVVILVLKVVCKVELFCNKCIPLSLCVCLYFVEVYSTCCFKGSVSLSLCIVKVISCNVIIEVVVVVKVDAEQNLLLVKGAVPGNKGGLVRVQYAVKGDK